MSNIIFPVGELILAGYVRLSFDCLLTVLSFSGGGGGGCVSTGGVSSKQSIV